MITHGNGRRSARTALLLLALLASAGCATVHAPAFPRDLDGAEDGTDVTTWSPGAAPAADTSDALPVVLDEPAAGTTTAVIQNQSEEDVKLAKQLNNPVANLISFPFQYNYDAGLGADGRGHRNTLNIQPVIPIPLDADWNIISRTILPIIDQKDTVTGTGSQGGFGNITQSFFLSPVKPTAGGWIWGVGPAFLIPTANNELLGPNKWGAGPTAVVLKQDGPWTIGALGNQIWSVGGSGNSEDVSAMFLQPFCVYTTPERWSYGVNSESTYDWEAKRWSIPINAFVTKLVRIGELPVSIGGGLRYWVDSPDGGPEGLGFRIIFTPIFPR